MATKILILGGGPGGYVAAIRAAQLGGDVTVVEQDTMGGTCLNVGCIPTKALLHTAQLFTDAGSGAAYGVVAAPVLDFAAAQRHKAGVVKQLVGGVEGLMKANKITVMRGSAFFTDKGTVQVNGSEVSFDKAIIATGSVPAKPPIPGADGPRCIDSTGALALEAVPQRLVIVGGV